MTKRSFFVIGSMGLLVVLVAGTVTALYAFRDPPWNPAYFTPSCQIEYATLEQAFAHYVAALQADEPSLYNKVLGYGTGISAEEFPLYSGPNPTVVERHVRGDYGFIWTSKRWEVNFRRVGGRWVFQPESLRLYVLELLGR